MADLKRNSQWQKGYDTACENAEKTKKAIAELYEAEIKALKERMARYEDFAEFVADEIFDENWEKNVDAFVVMACRKLERLGLIHKENGCWALNEGAKKNADSD